MKIFFTSILFLLPLAIAVMPAFAADAGHGAAAAREKAFFAGSGRDDFLRRIWPVATEIK